MNNSMWIGSAEGQAKRYDNLKENIESDICIVGGGLTGITSAYYLTKAGKKVTLLEKNYIGSHTTRKYYW